MQDSFARVRVFQLCRRTTQKYEDRPLVLHTLPAPKGKAPAQTDQPAAAEPVTDAAPVGGEKKGKRVGLHTSLATIPRLVTVVEIIKREYLKTLDPVLAEAGSLSGLHQYNEVGDLEEAGYVERADDDEQARMEALALALQGRNQYVLCMFSPRACTEESVRSAKQKKTAFMRVTLCRKEIPELIGRGATYVSPSFLRRPCPYSRDRHQQPAVRKLSKSARARLKKKARKGDP